MSKDTDIVTVWDGEEFQQLTRKEATALVKADKAQNLDDGLVDGLSLKYRHEFTGYKTREIRPETPAPAAVVKPAKPKKPARKKKPAKAADDVDWKAYRKEAAAALGKAVNKTTKAETLKYVEDKEG
jgi:hypothetical protein